MDTTVSYKPLPLRLLPLDMNHAEAFYDLVNDPEVRNYFEHFCASKEEILARMPDPVEDAVRQDYWLVAEGEQIVAYATLKKNVPVYEALCPKPELDVDAPEFLASFDRSPEEQQALDEAERTAQLAKAPYAVDVIVHRDHRERGIAVRSFELVAGLALERGVSEVYLEAHRDNAVSHGLARKLRSELVHINERFYYPSSIYRYPRSHLSLERKFRGFWRELVDHVPELLPHQKLVREWYYGFGGAHLTMRFVKDRADCKLGQELGYQNRMFTMQVSVAKRDELLSLIWSLFHEQGHFHQQEPTEAEATDGTPEKYAREADAWAIAERLLLKHAFFLENQASFAAYRDEALKTYEVPN